MYALPICLGNATKLQINKVMRKRNHLIYMDDLKIFTSNKKELNTLKQNL